MLVCDAGFGDGPGLRPEIEQAVAGQSDYDETRAATFARLKTMLRDTNAVLGHCAEHDKASL